MVSVEIWTPSIQDGSIYHFAFRLIMGSESVLTRVRSSNIELGYNLTPEPCWLIS